MDYTRQMRPGAEAMALKLGIFKSRFDEFKDSGLGECDEMDAPKWSVCPPAEG